MTIDLGDLSRQHPAAAARQLTAQWRAGKRLPSSINEGEEAGPIGMIYLHIRAMDDRQFDLLSALADRIGALDPDACCTGE